MENITDFLATNPWVEISVWFVGLVLLAIIVNFLVRILLVRGTRRIFNRFHAVNTGEIDRSIRYIANIAPALVFSVGIDMVTGLPAVLASVIKNVANAFIIFTIVMAISSLMNMINRLYELRPEAKLKPIKGYIQVLKIALFAIAAILMIATLIDRSPLILFSGLGAMAAVLILVFQDTLLSLIAGIQISSTDMVRIGDWIEMPNSGANGTVLEIALHTIKVQNFDNTITTVPIRKLVTDPFINWRGMQESGGRRIKRSLFIDQNSIHFLTREEQEKLSHYNQLEQYFSTKLKEIEEWNSKVEKNRDIDANTRRMTNIGTFRAYVNAYLRSHPNINQSMTLLVRQMEPDPDGLPIEIYCFTNTVAWDQYENIQSDMFDHLYAVMPDFGLQIFQNPAGSDFKRGFAFNGQENS